MKEIIVVIQPFDFKQNIYIFEDKVLRVEAASSMQDLPDTILKLARGNEIYKIKLKGAVDFAQKTKEELRTLELSQYKSVTLDVELI